MDVSRLAQQNARLKARIERLQRLLDAAESEGTLAAEGLAGDAVPDFIAGFAAPSPFTRVPALPADMARRTFSERDWQHGLLPFPGFANASASETVEECIGLNALGAPEALKIRLIRELQGRIESGKRYTYVVVTDEADFSYYIQRGITFEHIGYLGRLRHPAWRRYFEANLELIRRKYGLKSFISIGSPDYRGASSSERVAS
jgi:hypothetical protein